ncbi:MAG TPA: glycoside hydrolase family 2 TIM barrel-domain containing protein [Candidatus Binatia bacterium]|nr:glycoside hydrolase family 2 TIM barrel-domain containing protein [Candidatus Binatia bacterium]
MVSMVVAATALLLLSGAGLSGCGDSGSSQPTPQATPPPDAQASALFLLYSDAGTLTDEGDGAWLFTMNDPWDQVVVFTDRPLRDATSMGLADWVAAWESNGFVDNPPNAAITMTIHGSDEIDWAIMTLFAPRLLADGSLQFAARFLQLPDGRDAFYPTIEGSGPKPSFSVTQVFVDSAGVAGPGSAQQLAQMLLPRPVKGMCYVPAPSDYRTSCNDAPKSVYYDSDFYNADFQQLWGLAGTPARGDLKAMADLKVNFLHLYDWNRPAERNHLPFLNAANFRGMKVAVPISNYYVQQQNQGWIDEIVSEITTNKPPAVVMWAIGNEIDTGDRAAADQVATIAQWIAAKDTSRLITVPLKLPFEGKMQVLKQAFDAKGLTNLWDRNFIASINVYDDAPALQVHVENFHALYPTVPLLVSEMNRRLSDAGGNRNTQAQQLLEQLQKSTAMVGDGSHPHFFGSYVFEWTEKPWGCPDDEKFFGINGFSGSLGTGTTTSGQSYPVDGIAPNAMSASVRQAFQ